MIMANKYKVLISKELQKLALLQAEYIIETNKDINTSYRDIYKQIRLLRLPNQSKENIKMLKDGLILTELEKDVVV